MTPEAIQFSPINSTNKNLISLICMNSMAGDSTGIAKVGLLLSLCEMVLH